jgi:tetratricopeptide (TPR) repeat protein/AraC-like DNA-binding protein
MTLAHLDDREFIQRLSEFILANLEDETLCVKELAAKSGMSAHTLNQRLHSINKKHLSQFIREVRLQKAFELLRNGTYTAAEVAYQVGFSSPAYFNKCFHDFYGYPPGKIISLGYPGSHPVDEKQHPYETKVKTSRKQKRQILLLSVLLLAISAVVATYVVRNPDQIKFNGHAKPGAGRVSLAVFPFRNMTNDSSWNIWQEGVQACLINALSNSGNILVRSEESINSIISSKGVTSYASLKPEIAGNISQKLEAGIFIYGNISKAGNTVRLNAELINSGDESVVSSFHLDGGGEKILQMIDSLSVLINNSVAMSELKKVKPEEIHDYNDYTVKSPEAYRYFIYGNLAFYRNDFTTAKDWYFQALAKDSTFYKPMARLALTFYNESDYEQGKEWCRKYYKYKDAMNMRDRIAANSLYALFFGTYYDRIKYLKQLLDLDDQNPMTWFNIGDCYYEMMEYEKAIPEFEKALGLFHKFGTTPYWGAFYYELGISYHKTGQYNKEKKLYKKAEKDFPDDPGLLDQQVWLELSLGNNDVANSYLEKWRTIRKEEGWSEAQLAGYMAYIYSMADMPGEEEQCYRKALSLEPEKASRLNSLAYFLIDKGRNMNEGLALVEKALQLYPDNYNSMHIKGYAFYKQGKYPEALDMMQKSWNLRMQRSIYHHRAFLQLEEAKKAVFKS